MLCGTLLPYAHLIYARRKGDLKMVEAENKRQRRTPQERANELDEKITKINQSINELEEKKKTVVEEYDAKITAAKERIKSLEAKKQEILAPKAPRKPRKTKKQKIQEIVKLDRKAASPRMYQDDAAFYGAGRLFHAPDFSMIPL